MKTFKLYHIGDNDPLIGTRRERVMTTTNLPYARTALERYTTLIDSSPTSYYIGTIDEKPVSLFELDTVIEMMGREI